jgi:predicted acylesterase/phospholipase RssA
VTAEATVNGRTVFVLGGGGALGAFQAGALLALVEHDVVPDAIYGASVGSLNGAYLAHDPGRRRARELVQWWRGEHVREMLSPSPWNRLRGAAAALGGADALFDERPLRRLVDEHVGAHDIAELAVPLVVTTTCLDCGQAAHHANGAIADVLVASCALPGLFPAVRLHDGHRHVDAGVLCGVPLRAAIAAAGPDDRIFVLDCALAPLTSRAGCAASGPHYEAPVEPHRGVLQAVLESFTVARAAANIAEVGDGLSDPRVQVAPHIADAWVAGHLAQLPAGPRDCSVGDDLLAAGYAATDAWLADADADLDMTLCARSGRLGAAAGNDLR